MTAGRYTVSCSTLRERENTGTSGPNASRAGPTFRSSPMAIGVPLNRLSHLRLVPGQVPNEALDLESLRVSNAALEPTKTRLRLDGLKVDQPALSHLRFVRTQRLQLPRKVWPDVYIEIRREAP